MLSPYTHASVKYRSSDTEPTVSVGSESVDSASVDSASVDPASGSPDATSTQPTTEESKTTKANKKKKCDIFKLKAESVCEQLKEYGCNVKAKGDRVQRDEKDDISTAMKTAFKCPKFDAENDCPKLNLLQQGTYFIQNVIYNIFNKKIKNKE